MGLSLTGPSGVGLGLRALRWLACVDPVSDASGFPYRPSMDVGRGTGDQRVRERQWNKKNNHGVPASYQEGHWVLVHHSRLPAWPGSTTDDPYF